MSLLTNLTTDDTIAGERDSVGGSVLDSGLYPSKITLAYLTKSDGGAVGLVLNAKSDQGREIRSTMWMTSGTAKGGLNTYTDTNGAKQYLPGFLMASSLSLLTVGKELNELVPETKVVPVYNKAAKAEVPTKVEMLTELLGQDILIGLLKQTVDKTVKNESTGKYEPTGETREENEIDKFFRARDRMTVAEVRAQATEAAFAATWEAKHKGNTRNKAKGATGASGVAGAPKGAAAAAKPKTSLFAA
jgi:hypothetical protein